MAKKHLLEIKGKEEKVSLTIGHTTKRTTRENVLEWCLDGIINTEGAEQEHFLEIFVQLIYGGKNFYY